MRVSCVRAEAAKAARYGYNGPQVASKPESGRERKRKGKGKYSICGTSRSCKGPAKLKVPRVLPACAKRERNDTFHGHFTACEMPVKHDILHGKGQRRKYTWVAIVKRSLPAQTSARKTRPLSFVENLKFHSCFAGCETPVKRDIPLAHRAREKDTRNLNFRCSFAASGSPGH